MSDFEKGKYGEKRVESEEWSDDIIWPGESIEWSIDILKKCPLWTFPPLFIARFVPQKWPSLETMNDYIDNPRPCLLTEREKEGVRYEELEWWYDFLLFREEPDDFSTYWDDPFGYIVGITECIRKDYSDDELLRFQQEIERKYVYSCMEIDFENALERLGTLREELKHIEGVLQAILDDDMADFVWTKETQRWMLA